MRAKFAIFYLLLVYLGFTTSAQAAHACPKNEQSAPAHQLKLKQLWRQAETLRIADSSLPPEQAFRRLVLEEPSIPVACRGWLADRYQLRKPWDFKVRIRMPVNAGKQTYAVREAPVESLLNLGEVYRDLAIQHWCKKEEDGRRDAERRTPAYDAAVEALDRCLASSGSLDEFWKMAAQNKGDRSEGLPLSSEDRTRLKQAIGEVAPVLDLVRYRTEQEQKTWARTEGLELSPESFVESMMVYGAVLYENYDDARRDEKGGRGDGYPTGDQLATRTNGTANHALLQGARVKVPSSDDEPKLGLCRDYAPLIANLLAERRFKNSSVIAFAVPDGFHMVTVAEHPTDDDVVYQLDYGKSVRMDGVNGIGNLDQVGHDDMTLNYQVFGTDHSRDANLPSPFLKLLAGTSGFTVERLGRLTKEDSTVIETRRKLDNAGKVEAFVYAAEDPHSAKQLGAGVSFNYLGDGHFPGKAAVQLGYRQRNFVIDPFRDEERETYDQHLGVAYAQIQQNFISPELKVLPELAAEIKGDIVMLGAATVTSQSLGAPVTNLQGDIKLGTEIKIKLRDRAGRYRGQVIAGASVSPTTADVRVNGIEKATLSLDEAYLETSHTLHLDPETFLFLSAALAGNDLGLRGRAALGIDGVEWGGQLYGEGALTDDTAIYQEGADRRVGLKLRFSPNDDLEFLVGASQGIESETTDLTLTVKGGF